MCKETPKTKFRIPNMHGAELTRADINITQATTVLCGGLFYLKEHEKEKEKNGNGVSAWLLHFLD